MNACTLLKVWGVQKLRGACQKCKLRKFLVCKTENSHSRVKQKMTIVLI